MSNIDETETEYESDGVGQNRNNQKGPAWSKCSGCGDPTEPWQNEMYVPKEYVEEGAGVAEDEPGVGAFKISLCNFCNDKVVDAAKQRHSILRGLDASNCIEVPLHKFRRHLKTSFAVIAQWGGDDDVLEDDVMFLALRVVSAACAHGGIGGVFEKDGEVIENVEFNSPWVGE